MQLALYDTTLRDGAQTEGISFSTEDKLRIAQRLDAYGVHYIEGGFPGSNPKDREFFRRAAKIPWRQARISAFGATRYKDRDVAEDPTVAALLACETPAVTIVAMSIQAGPGTRTPDAIRRQPPIRIAKPPTMTREASRRSPR